jgi:hypothetical protein
VELAKKVSSALLWKNAAMKAYGLLTERDRRVEELRACCERELGLEVGVEGMRAA